MTLFFAQGSPTTDFSDEDIRIAIVAALDALGPKQKVIVVPPDFTRYESRAGRITSMTYNHLGESIVDVIPALGTHFPMSDSQIDEMFPGLPHSLIRIHNWREDVVTLGEVPAEFVRECTNGIYDRPWSLQMNRLIVEGGHDLILSIGQVVPHEVMGMANYNKNLFIGTGGATGINESHYISALCGIENILGRADNPLRRILNEGERLYCCELPILYVLTVVGTTVDGDTAVRGLFIGDDVDCFAAASELAVKVNFTFLDEPIERMVVYLDQNEFHSTWLGNKSIYRSRMAIADGGELIVLAPGVSSFGEDPMIDKLIRKYGYRTTPEVKRLVDENADLQQNLGAAAHFMHSSSEGRFKIIYCPGGLTREETEKAGFSYGDINSYLKHYNPEQLSDGWNSLSNGERFYFISKPALGLWTYRDRLEM